MKHCELVSLNNLRHFVSLRPLSHACEVSLKLKLKRWLVHSKSNYIQFSSPSRLRQNQLPITMGAHFLCRTRDLIDFLPASNREKAPVRPSTDPRYDIFLPYNVSTTCQMSRHGFLCRGFPPKSRLMYVSQLESWSRGCCCNVAIGASQDIAHCVCPCLQNACGHFSTVYLDPCCCLCANDIH